ncbi:MAG: hypothetical protein IKG23_08450 [Clostridia bacterium]|nr:hypothetical protein [Clostridia bacterium]
MRLMVAVPTTDYVHAEFMKCLVGLTKKLASDGVDFEEQIIGGTLIYWARNRIAHRAIEGGFTHVLWLDSDMTFKPDIVDDLLWCGKDIVCGAFVSRRPPYGPCVYTSIEDPANMTKVEDFGTEPFLVDGCGFATVLTSVSLLKAVMDRFDTCFMPTEQYGEDMAFCDRVKQIGGEIWCEPTVRPGHIAHVPVYAGEHLFGGDKA